MKNGKFLRIIKDQQNLLEFIRKVVYDVLDNEKFFQGEWQIGTVAEVISDKMLNVYVNGSDVPQKIPCNPDVRFKVGDEVWVHNVNRDSKNKFVPYKRGV